MKFVLISSFIVCLVIAENFEQSWRYVDVRPGVHMFYWLFKTSHADGPTQRPLVMWLQGGPGGSSTGYGNFEIIGPYNIDKEYRNSTWAQEANILFVDNPVGAGFSYVDDLNDLTTTTEEISQDLFVLFKSFLDSHPEFKTVPFYIFGQSYGGKMAANYARKLHTEIQAGNLECNLGGFAMGNAWTHPLDSTLTWANFLFEMSTVDETGRDEIQRVAEQSEQAALQGRWRESTQFWRATQRAVNEHTNYVDFYNILKFRVFSQNEKKPTGVSLDDTLSIINAKQDPRLPLFMNTEVREYLGVIPDNVLWGGQQGPVFAAQEEAFMKDVLDDVDYCLNKTDMDVIVYQGQLDLICDTTGSMLWVQKLKWENMPNYFSADRVALTTPENGQTEMFVKAHEQFKFYWVLRAGHAVPKDQGDSALRMLQRIIRKDDN
ncbi:DgyrCDS8246 [Dimorphilus gyrociliatus]|uniref:Retinoid-inducible serine carboxypeptidase n=1 Tax=Dimorphilus gyrociliatus TaxID=2664684 RepID=A0A7I8VUK7_9ANNE|nr:DgyrCDS8246 [Dimorphilus gyrociliatus]